MDFNSLLRKLIVPFPEQAHNWESFVDVLRPWKRSPLEIAGVEPGMYHYMRENEGSFTRFHLRIDSTGQGLLLANAIAVARLRPSGVIIAKGLLEGDETPLIVDHLVRSFRGVSIEQAAGDIDRVGEIIAALAAPGDNYPILNLADPSFSPEFAPLDKPLSADVPLAEPDRLVPILDRLWEVGIPHVMLVAGDDPDSKALVRAVERAEDLGMIAGIRGRGSDLAVGTLIEDLAQAGADHVDVLYLSADPAVHDQLAGNGDHAAAARALAEVRRNEVCPVAEIALVEDTLEGIEETLESLAAQGIANAAFFAVVMADGKATGGAVGAGHIVQAARLIEELADEADLRLIWYPPVRFHLGDSLAPQVRRGPRCSGDTAIRVDCDGSVFVARGPLRPAGNLLKDRWESIRKSEIYRTYRRRLEADTHCDDCPGLAICAADCPRHSGGWAEGSG